MAGSGHQVSRAARSGGIPGVIGSPARQGRRTTNPTRGARELDPAVLPTWLYEDFGVEAAPASATERAWFVEGYGPVTVTPCRSPVTGACARSTTSWYRCGRSST
ncbi:hypothetical protein CFN78_22135 [Amycolatopsis antarctica]|uniref:Uncharacterized protein n=1 Tax=Amycolatopsis antarctica TaxID=1854586 RepID=A0A263CZ33_9PSEU|nr:hypothetical protein CFN78_22135 [Amycolatopsis antarctica]